MKQNKEQTMTFLFIGRTIDMSMGLFNMDTNLLVGALNSIFLNHKSLIEQDETLCGEDKTELINENFEVIFEAVNRITTLSEITHQYKEYKINQRCKVKEDQNTTIK
ncbi:hypothetical protein [Dysgonomonas sp. Marseille-P4361]|uniref:hypothetical protein n=1 Tax=Dysgonomonas sp. Marseille-P4361 TaxID=2161820 RepID=UPI00135B8980|nr:hypothetical protein [Dysgonomonas sp. Marseille-P4361]